MKKVIYLLCLCLYLPFSAMGNEDGYVDIDGVKHYYKMIGSGEPILVLHGGPGMSHDYLLPHLEPLAEDFKLIFYDQRGNGNSEVRLSEDSFTIAKLVADLEGLRKAFGIKKLNILGHSWGGLLALYYSLEYPENVDTLILSNPAAANDRSHMKMLETKNQRYTPEKLAQINQLMQSKAFTEGDISTFKQLITLVEGVNAYDEQRMPFILSGLQYTQESMKRTIQISELSRHFFDRYDLLPTLGNISAETLIIHGDADSIPLSSDEAIASSMPNAKLVRLRESGHYPFAEQSAEFFKIIRAFLAPN